MKFLGNIIWLVFGGLMTALEYLISSLAMMLTIVGIPFGIQTLKLAQLSLWPFGKKVVKTEQAGGCLTVVMNIIWIIIGGIWIALTHVLWGIVLAITIVGLPFAKQHFKLAGIALSPFGRQVVDDTSVV